MVSNPPPAGVAPAYRLEEIKVDLDEAGGVYPREMGLTGTGRELRFDESVVLGRPGVHCLELGELDRGGLLFRVFYRVKLIYQPTGRGFFPAKIGAAALSDSRGGAW